MLEMYTQLSVTVERILLEGYCRDLPSDLRSKVLTLYEHHGFVAAAEVAILLVDLYRAMRKV